MGIKLVKVPDFKRYLANAREDRKQAMQRELLFARTGIIGRTNQGRDVDDVTFVQYSDEYADWKEKKGYQSNPPNLTVTGDMLRAIQVTVIETPQSIIGKLFFADATESLKARSVQRLRKFFALSAEQIGKIVRALNGRERGSNS